MAATRLIPLHENKGKTVSQCLKDRTDYAKNGEKTEDGEYVTAYECNPEIVDQEFYSSRNEYLKDHRDVKGDVIAYQIRQSFKPGEVGPEEANAIGYETAMKFTKGRHAFIVATHTDKEHIHNHIIFNSTNLDCDRKFKNFFLSSFVIQRISDGLCLEHGLSVIKPKPYKERSKRTDYPKRESYRDKICDIIDTVLSKKPDDFDHYLRMLEEENLIIKRGKNPAVKMEGQKRFIRFRSLGDGYSVPDIEKIISGEMEQEQQRRKNGGVKPERKVDLLIDIQEKLAQGKGAGYERWAKVYNVKAVAKALLFLQQHDIRDIDDLRKKADDTSARFAELSSTIKTAEKRMAEIAVLKTHILNYSKTRDVYVAYRKAGYSRAFFEAHREEITLHKAAKQAFSDLGVDKIPTIKQLNEEYGELLAQKKEAYKHYREAKQEMTDFATAKYDIERFLNLSQEESQHQEQEKEKQKKQNKSR